MTVQLAYSSIPEQGQLVEVRQRRYAVTDIAQSTLPASLLYADAPPQHLVTLTSVEDDALGEELQAIWELEARLARIPEELEQKIAQIRGRYADAQFRLFPIAVTFFVPQRLSSQLKS